ncbi:MAG: ATP synthase subunit C [Verrucomicrobiales bacterium]|nr:ATP synthase subunit C [Verrucomicrobiales bacterium]
MKTKKMFTWIAGILLAGAFWAALSAGAAEDAAPTAGNGDQPSVYRAVGLGAAAAFAIAVSVLGAGYAVGRIGSAAVGALAEKPELLPRTIIFVALAEGLAVLGFAVAMMLLQKI